MAPNDCKKRKTTKVVLVVVYDMKEMRVKIIIVQVGSMKLAQLSY